MQYISIAEISCRSFLQFYYAALSNQLSKNLFSFQALLY